METNGSHCPEGNNSTDCLLRTLLQLIDDIKESNDTEFNWDPLSFAFTLLIGLLAIAFAFMTILQAIFTASKGRRKASLNAIGKWSTETVTRWRFLSLESQTSAFTPVLKFMGVWTALEKNTDSKQDPQKEKLNKNYSPHAILERVTNWLLSLLPRAQGTSTSSATWIGFLAEVGLESIRLPSDSRKEIATDYLPDDLVAAPAFAQVSVIFTTAACAGAIWVFDNESKFPILIGPGFQFDFRTHPVLGTVGAYSRYETRSRPKTPSISQLQTAMRNSSGELDSRGGLFVDYKGRKTLKGYAGLVGSFHSTFIVYPWFRYFWKQCNSLTDFAVSPELMKNDFLPLLRLFHASTPDYAPALLPVSKLRMRHPLSLLALNGSYWSKTPLTAFTHWKKFHQPIDPDWPAWSPFEISIGQMEDSDERPEIMDHRSDDEAETQTTGGDIPINLPGMKRVELEDQEPDPRILFLNQRTIHMSLLLLEAPNELEEWFLYHSPQDQREMRSMVLKQLKDIDRWLGANPFAQNRACLLFNTTLSLFRAHEMHEDGHFKDLSVPNHTGLDHEPLDNMAASFRHISMLGALSSITTLFPPETGDKGKQPLETFSAANDSNNKFQSLRDSLTGTYFPRIKEEDVEINKKRILDRLSFIANHNLNPQPEENSSNNEQSDNEEVPGFDEGRALRVTDDVIIYRCLLMALLLWTAPDCSNLMLSGIWEQVIPII
ncbi:hypothetical protein FPANT_13816 [Fusarium pseudoanthophilum]|uniref:Uncharacterized protein n=1 Tax=Fusarium pseudoanthophilum TaxID=48495 RepID=A0A8H5NLM3_9HYPO|nr:hypothetical protein FPANT_13816 [Fusarium pseudoanthophilum]